LELVVVLALLEMDLWALRALEIIPLRVAAYAAIAAVLWISNRRRRASATAPHDSVRSWIEALAVTLGMAMALCAAANVVREPYEECWQHLLRKSAGELAGWALVKTAVTVAQQVALTLFLWPVCCELVPNRAGAVALAAGLFGLVHLPVPTLVGLTAAAAVLWLWLYQRGGCLLPLIASHLTVAVLVHGLWPERLICEMRVGSAALELQERRAIVHSAGGRLLLRVLASEEYYGRQGGNDRAYIVALYHDLFDRAAAASEQETWLANLRRIRRVEAVEALLMSPEFQAKWPGHN
jgi:hypothetical protein